MILMKCAIEKVGVVMSTCTLVDIGKRMDKGGVSSAAGWTEDVDGRGANEPE